MKRDYRLDLIRSIAIICVVINHAIEQVYPIHDFSILNHSMKSQLFCFSGWVVGRTFGVPLFFFLTGFLLLSRDYSETDKIKRFYSHNLIPLAIAWEGWILIYQLFICLRDKQLFSIVTYLKCAFLLKRVELPHTWYVPVILGVYLFLPFISFALKKMDNRILIALILIVYLYSFTAPSISLIVSPKEVDPILSSQLYLAFSGGVYGCYIVTGYCLYIYRYKIDDFFLSKYRVTIVIIIGGLSLFGTIFIQLFLRNSGSQYCVYYEFFLIPITAVCAFIFATKTKLNTKMQIIVSKVSLSSFGIYCIHELVIQCFYISLQPDDHAALFTVVLSIAAFTISLFVTILLSKVQCTKWLVLKKENKMSIKTASK